MSKYALKSLVALAVMPLVASCASTGQVAKVDAVKQRMDLQTSADPRSAMPDMRENGSVNSALANLKDEVKKEPRRVKSLLNLAQIHLVQKRYDEAEQACRQALKADLKNQDARKILAQIYLRKGNSDMAGIILNGLGGDHSKDSQVLNMMALIALKENRRADALTLFNRALQANASDVSVRMNLGVLYVEYRQLQNAAVQFERVLKLMPDHNDAKLHLAIVKATQGQLAQAGDIYKEILGRKGDNPLALYNMAVLEKRRENYDDAIERLKTYLKTNYARNADNAEVFALIDDIRSRQDSPKGSVSDKEIQALAAKMGRTPGQQQAQAEEPTTGAADVEEPQSEPAPEDDEISSLEKQLQ